MLNFLKVISLVKYPTDKYVEKYSFFFVQNIILFLNKIMKTTFTQDCLKSKIY